MEVSFNSRLVQLKAGDRPSNSLTFSLFQFQIGAIKGGLTKQYYTPSAAFQFQIGAIKGKLIPLNGLLLDGFQFQIGAIKGTLLCLAIKT